MSASDIADEITTAISHQCPHTAVRLAAAGANACRAVGLVAIPRWLAAWAYDIADATMAAEPAFDTHRATMPWAWNADRTLLAWWGRA